LKLRRKKRWREKQSFDWLTFCFWTKQKESRSPSNELKKREERDKESIKRKQKEKKHKKTGKQTVAGSSSLIEGNSFCRLFSFMFCPIKMPFFA